LLSDYQASKLKEAKRIFNRHNFVLINGQMRTGKTFLAMDIVKDLRALVITKKRVIGDIQENIDLMLENGYEFRKYEIANYESLHKKKPEDYDVIIADEYHNVGYIQKQSKKYKMYKSFVGTKPVIALTGTVFSETFATAYSLCPFAFPGCRNFYKWHHEYGIPKTKYLKGLTVPDYRFVQIDKVMDRLMKYTVSMDQVNAGFKGKVVDKVWNVPLDAKQAKYINMLRKDKMINEFNYIADTSAKEFLAICQIQSGTLKLDNDTSINISSRKCNLINTYFINKGIKKLVILYRYKQEREFLKCYFTTTDDHKKFKEMERGIFIGQFRSCMEGIKLDTADDIIFYSMPWSNLEYLQARQRIMNKSKIKATCHLLLAGMEDKIYDTVVNRKGKFSTEMYRRIKPTLNLN